MKNFKFIFFAMLLLTIQAFGQLKTVQYKDGEQILNGLKIDPVNKSSNKPGILILPAWKGIDKHSKETAESLAALGYYAFVADIYGEGNYPANNAEAGKKCRFLQKKY